MRENRERGIVVVEGEKCADLMREAMPRAIVTTCSGGNGAYHLADWTPLMGRNVVIMADQDEGGIRAARWLADHLGLHCPIVTLVLPDGESKHPDCGDAIETGGVEALQVWMKTYMERWEPPVPPADPSMPDEPPGYDETPPAEEAPGKRRRKPPPPPPPPEDDLLGENRWFTILGGANDKVIFKLRTNIVIMASRESLVTPQKLISLAPDLNWWRAMLQVDSMSRAAAMIAGAGMLRIADDMGQIDMTSMYDRGVTKNAGGETVWNLGNKLVGERGREGPALQGRQSVAPPRPPSSSAIPRAPVLDLDARSRIADTLLRYRWASDDDGKRLLGWNRHLDDRAVCWNWRPHLWMLGPMDVGKSWFVKKVMMRIHASVAVRTSDATPAAIARRMGGASTPLYVDEAEPSRWWVPDVITLCRIASGADGERLRADATGGTGFNSQEPRFSACMSSTKMPSMEDPDNSRFTLIRFSANGVKDWPALKAEIIRLFDPPSTTPQDLRHALVMEAHEIAAETLRLTSQLEGEGRPARDSMISAALTAGWSWWTGSDEIVNNRTPLASEPQADARNILMELLGHRVRTHHGEDRSLLDFLEYGADKTNADLLGSYGLKVMHDGLAIMPKHPAISRILSRGRAKGADLRSLLLQMERIKRCGSTTIGGMRARPLVVDRSTLEEMGVDWPAASLPV